MMEHSGDRSPSSLAETIEPTCHLDVKHALLSKRETLLRDLEELDATISLTHHEYSAKLEQLQAKKKPLEEALHHAEALLRFEGCYLDNSQTNDNNARTGIAADTSITDAAFGLLEELHQPLHYKDMALKLQGKNVYISGRNPAATLLSRINRDSRFKRTAKRGVYALSTWRIPSVKRRGAKSRRTKR